MKILYTLILFLVANISFANNSCLERSVMQESFSKFKKVRRIFMKVIQREDNPRRQVPPLRRARLQSNINRIQRKMRTLEAEFTRLSIYPDLTTTTITYCDSSIDPDSLNSVDRYRLNQFCLAGYRRELNRERSLMQTTRRRESALSTSFAQVLRGETFRSRRAVFNARRVTLTAKRLLESKMTSQEKRMVRNALSYSYRNIISKPIYNFCSPLEEREESPVENEEIQSEEIPRIYHNTEIPSNLVACNAEDHTQDLVPPFMRQVISYVEDSTEI